MKNGTIREFGKLCKMTQKKLKEHLVGRLESFGYKVINEDGYLYAKGELPYLLTAHMDTVHAVTCRNYKVGKTTDGELAVYSDDGIGGDDRCGIYMILRVLKDGFRPSILFCEDEEVGGVGSNKFCKSKWIDDLKKMRYLIELDRANANDVVFYDCGNKDFIKFITKTTGYKEAIGSFSDISHLSPACDVASVNISCGYYKAHTTNEFVVISEMENSIEVVEKLLKTECKQYDFQEIERWSSRYGNIWYDDYYGSYYGYGYSGKSYGKKEEILEGVEICYADNGTLVTEAYWGDSLEYCLGEFMLEHPSKCLNDIAEYECIYW